ncbi:hypothetical protein HLB44_14440 [Aquincola sp. S2]|uniref:Uncharacterized protein n=1 Tax=Pseudaquabacterium terrae TaxID=2732868 RepID=A0ABX2EHU2_9BURK|nr:hypothetical protein [Aquabacterium terrae]NRF68189.1 hypothetical protein [Aquabacterium terrae]
MDPRVLQAAERVLAWARSQAVAGLPARPAPDSEPPAEELLLAAEAADETEPADEDAPIGH